LQTALKKSKGKKMEKVNENEKEYRKGNKSGPKYLMRGPKLEWGIIRLEPGEAMGAHGHNEVEEVFYFFEGEPKILVNDKEHRVKQGDVFRLEAKEKHDIVNDTSAPVRYIFIKCPFLPEDKITY